MVWNFVNGKNQILLCCVAKIIICWLMNQQLQCSTVKQNLLLITTTAAGEKEQYRGERIFINTGALPVMLPIPGLAESNAILDSTAAMDQKEMPEKLVIIGAGYIGLEFASMFAKYGSKVTVLDLHEQFLPREDDDIASEIKKDMENSGVTFELGVKINRVDDQTVYYGKDGHSYEAVAGSNWQKTKYRKLRFRKYWNPIN